LTQNTADGLHVTIKSTLELTKYLLDKCLFKYVLTCKINQYCLEVSIELSKEDVGRYPRKIWYPDEMYP